MTTTTVKTTYDLDLETVGALVESGTSGAPCRFPATGSANALILLDTSFLLLSCRE